MSANGSQTPKVFCVGWAKTGTTTFGAALRQLGSRHMSQDFSLLHEYARGNLDAVFDVAERYDSFDDWPWILLYRELDDRFPGSKFVLTTRSEKTWLRSYANMQRTEGPPDESLRRIRDIIYGFHDLAGNEERLVRIYLDHNESVRARFRDRPGTLLEADWEQGDGWRELCAFLGNPVPDTPFPHLNRGTYAPDGRP